MVVPETVTPACNPMTFCTPKVAVSPVSTSAAPASMSMVKAASSSDVVSVRAKATAGTSLVPVTVTVTKLEVTAPLESVALVLTITSRVSLIAKSWKSLPGLKCSTVPTNTAEPSAGAPGIA